MYRLMQPSDKAAVLALWQRERGESEEFAANAVERFAGQQNVYVAEEMTPLPLWHWRCRSRCRGGRAVTSTACADRAV